MGLFTSLFGKPQAHMEAWKPLETEDDLTKLIERSSKLPCAIFKHSTRCGISSMAKSRIESSWDLSIEEVEIYYLDLLNFRPLSNKVAEVFGIYHQSPQIILVKNGEAIFDTSHSNISVEGIRTHAGIE